MTNESLHQFLVLYTWFPLAALIFFILLIARFYQKFSGIQTFFWYYVVVIVLLGVGSVRYASVDVGIGDVVTDVIFVIAGVILIFLCVRLYRYMVNEKSKL